MNTNYFNTGYASGITTNDMDRRYASDFVRDWWNQREYSGKLIQALMGTTANHIITGGVCTQGTGHTLDITTCNGVVKYAVTVPLDWTIIPPTTHSVDIPVYVESDTQTNLAITNAVTDNTTVNYVKLQYLETPVNVRVKAKDPISASYYAEVTPSYHITVNSTANSTYDILLATFKTNGTTITFLSNSSLIIPTLSNFLTGWIPANETWTYVSADAPVYTFTAPGDLTSKYWPGMRYMYTQTTVKYAILHAVSYSSGTGLTTFTIYAGGTTASPAYPMVSAAITNNYFAMPKTFPIGFPIDTTIWTVELNSTNDRTTNTPTQNVWYNAESISMPIGLWEIESSHTTYGVINGASINIFTTLSTANNSESDPDFTLYLLGVGAANATFTVGSTLFVKKKIVLTEKTILYLNIKTSVASVASLTIAGSGKRTIIRAICAYL